MAKKPSKKDVIEVYNRLRSKAETYKHFQGNISRDDLRDVLAGHSLPKEPDGVVSLRKQLAGLTKRLKVAEQEALNTQVVREEIFGIASMNPEPPKWLSASVRKSDSAPGIPTAHLSDLHLGEVVNPKEVNGVNEFNTQIAWQRIERFVQGLIDLCFTHMVNPSYPGLVLCLGGDNVTGRIHPELVATNDRTDLEAVIDAIAMLRWVIETLLEYFPKILVPAAVGNHSRTYRYSPTKQTNTTNYDWLIACQVASYFEGDDRVQFLIPDGIDCRWRIYDHSYLLTHGDMIGVKGGDGIIGSLGPIMRGKVKMLNQATNIHKPFDTLIMAHWHQLITLPGLRVNGALKGYDEFAEKFLRATWQRPMQDLWFTHPQHGVTFQMPIFLDDAKPSKASWTSWEVEV